MFETTYVFFFEATENQAKTRFGWQNNIMLLLHFG